MYWNLSSADTSRSLCEITCVIRGAIRPTLGTNTHGHCCHWGLRHGHCCHWGLLICWIPAGFRAQPQGNTYGHC